MSILVAVAVFAAALCVVEGIFFLLADRFYGESRVVRTRLASAPDAAAGGESATIRRGRQFSAVPWLSAFLSRIRVARTLDNMLLQANIQQPVALFALLSFMLLSGGFCAALVITDDYLLSGALAAISGIAPTLYVTARKRRRLRKFERQLPDALDLLARSLRAGHALSTGLRMVAREFDDPIGTEFHKTQAQIALGVSIDQAVKALTQQIDCAELKFFAISLVIQRETGGNLAELLENISTLIRSRLRLRGHVRSLSAESRLSAAILVGIPFVMAFVLWIINPSYIETLFGDPIGKRLVLAALLMMLIGIIVIRRMVRTRI